MSFAFIFLLKDNNDFHFKEKKFSFIGLRRNPVLCQISTMGFKIQVALDLGFLSIFLYSVCEAGNGNIERKLPLFLIWLHKVKEFILCSFFTPKVKRPLEESCSQIARTDTAQWYTLLSLSASCYVYISFVNTSGNHNEIPEFQGDPKVSFLILKERLNYVQLSIQFCPWIVGKIFKSVYTKCSLKKIRPWFLFNEEKIFLEIVRHLSNI